MLKKQSLNLIVVIFDNNAVILNNNTVIENDNRDLVNQD